MDVALMTARQQSAASARHGAAASRPVGGPGDPGAGAPGRYPDSQGPRDHEAPRARRRPLPLHLQGIRVLLVEDDDISMPGEDGYALLRRVRQRPMRQGGDIPAIAITAFAERHDRARTLGAGFQEHLPKPFDPERLCLVIERLAGGPR